MITVPADITPRDFSQWLSAGVAMLDGEFPVRVIEVGGQVHVDDLVNEQEQHIPWAEAPTRIAAHWPRCGSLNLDGFAVYLQRKQVKLYRRTYNERVLALSVPGKWDAMKVLRPDAMRVTPNTPSVIIAAFHPHYPDWEEAIARLADNWYSVAINPYVILGRQGDDVAVFYKGRRAGHINGDDQFIANGYDLAPPRIFKLLEGRVTL